MNIKWMCARDWGSTVFNFCCSVVKISSGYNYNAAEWFVFYIFIQYTCIFFLYHSGVFAPDIATSYWQMIIFLALMEICLVHSSPGIIIYLLFINII